VQRQWVVTSVPPLPTMGESSEKGLLVPSETSLEVSGIPVCAVLACL